MVLRLLWSSKVKVGQDTRNSKIEEPEHLVAYEMAYV